MFNKLNKKNKVILISGILVLVVVLTGLGMKYLPFSKLIKMPSGSQKGMIAPKSTRATGPDSYYYDFEVPTGKEMPGGFYKGIAHSGNYSVKAFGKNSFSYTIERTAADVGLQNLRAVAMSAWIYVFPTDNEVKGSLVFTASNNLGVNICWKGVSLVEPEVPKGKWFKISGYFDLKNVNFNEDTRLQNYFWNNTGTDILVDDFFIVFGGAVDRRGDSALVDLTRPGGYQQKFNYPPFPLNYLTRMGENTPVDPSKVSKDNFYITGDFFGTGLDGLLIIKKDGLLTGFSCCPEGNGSFISMGSGRIPVSGGKIIRVFAGQFTGAGTCQVLIQTEGKLYLCSFLPIRERCAPGQKLALNLLSTVDNSCQSVSVGRFSGTGKTQVLNVANDGSWELMSFESAKAGTCSAKIITHGDKPDNLPDWNIAGTNITVHDFLKTGKEDQLLVISPSGDKGQYRYNLLKFNTIKNKWESSFTPAKEGKTIGIDTLKPGDLFYVLEDESGLIKKLYRYNRDWRFDLKEISFNDSAFRIHSNTDFSGFPKNQNPKYYEELILVPGHFTGKHAVSVLVIGKNNSAEYKDILPGFSGFYGLTSNK